MSQLQVKVVHNATVLPTLGRGVGGVYVDQKPVVEALHPYGSYLEPIYQAPYSIHNNYITNKSIYCGALPMHFGHFLLEGLSRIWYAMQHPNLPIVWSSTNQHSVWQKEIFDILSIKNEHIFINEPTQFSNLIIPEQGFIFNHFFNPIYAKIIANYTSKKIIKGKKIYITRSNLSLGGYSNEAQIEHLLLENNWIGYSPELYSVHDQLEMFSTSEYIFGIESSAFHSLLLQSDIKSKLFVLNRLNTDNYDLIASVKKLEYTTLHLPKECLNQHMTPSRRLYTIDFEYFKEIMHKTHFLEKKLSQYAHVFVDDYLKIENNKPKNIYSSVKTDCNATTENYYFGMYHYGNKNYKLAKHYLLKATKLNQFVIKVHAHTAYHTLGLIHKNFNEFDDAIEAAKFCIKVAPELLGGYLLTELYRYTHQYDKAKQVMEELLASQPQEAGAYIQISHIYNAKNELQDAVFYASQAVDMEPKNFGFRVHFINLLRKKGDYDKATAIVDSELKVKPTWGEGYKQLSLICDALGERDSAVEHARKAVAVEPDNFGLRAHLSNLLRKNGAFEDASIVIHEALSINPEWGEGYKQLSLVHDAKQEYDTAVQYAQQAVTAEPANLALQTHLGDMFYKASDYESAITLLFEIVAVFPRNGEAYRQLSHIYNAQGNIEQAIACARKSVEFEPQHLSRGNHLANLLRKNGEMQEAMLVAQHAINLSPHQAWAYYQISQVYNAQKIFHEAIRFAQIATELSPDEKSYKKHLENLQKRKNDVPQVTDSNSGKVPVVSARINKLAAAYGAKTYLEIGVSKEATFFPVNITHKTAVDPKFQFEYKPLATNTVHFHEMPSDSFFEAFPQMLNQSEYISPNGAFLFDIIFIDGLHTFEQTLRDFDNSLLYSHDRTIWIFDDTCPSQCFSAMDSSHTVAKWRAVAGLSKDGSWHGDVFKVIFAIHEKYPEFSYCTQINNGNPQTILWKTKTPTERAKAFHNFDLITRMRYEDFVENAWVLHPVKDEEVIDKIFTNIDPIQYKTGEEYKIVIRRIVTDKERIYAAENKELKEKIVKLDKELKNHLENLTQLYRANF